jgi:hypothetical protein
MDFVSILMIFIIALLLLLLVGFIFVWFKAAAAQVAADNRQPVLSVSAQVVTKRHDTGGAGGISATSYYVGFELESGERKEFPVSGNEYGMLAEGDKGTLTYQGTRYQGFQRQRY